MKYQSLLSGLAGSFALTLLHETLRTEVASAPRMDKLGKQGLKKALDAAGVKIPTEEHLHEITLGGDILGNAGYYAMVGAVPLPPVVAGAALGLAAGAGAIFLPAKIGLNEKYSSATQKTKLMTLALYLAGGLVAGVVYTILSGKSANSWQAR